MVSLSLARATAQRKKVTCIVQQTRQPPFWFCALFFLKLVCGELFLHSTIFLLLILILLFFHYNSNCFLCFFSEF